MLFQLCHLAGKAWCPCAWWGFLQSVCCPRAHHQPCCSAGVEISQMFMGWFLLLLEQIKSRFSRSHIPKPDILATPGDIPTGFIGRGKRAGKKLPSLHKTQFKQTHHSGFSLAGVLPCFSLVSSPPFTLTYLPCNPCSYPVPSSRGPKRSVLSGPHKGRGAGLVVIFPKLVPCTPQLIWPRGQSTSAAYRVQSGHRF